MKKDWLVFWIDVFCFYNLPLIGAIVCVKGAEESQPRQKQLKIPKLLRLRFVVLIAFGRGIYPGATANCDTAV